MFRRIYRQRRRILLSAFFFALAIFATLSRHADWLFEDMQLVWYGPAVVLGLTSVIMGLLFAGVACLIILLIPDWRSLIDILALTFLADSLLAYALPGFFGFESAGGWGILTWFLLYFAIFSLIYGTALDRFRFWLGFRSRRSYVSPLPAEALWRKLVLGEGPLAEFYDPLLAEATADPEDPDAFEVTYRHGHSFFEHQTITYLERTPARSFRYYFQGEADPANLSLTEGTFAGELAPLPGGGTRITLSEDRPSMLPRLAIQMWLDDTLGDTCDRLRAEERKAGDWSLSGHYRRAVGKLA